MSSDQKQVALFIEEKLGPFVLREVSIYTPGVGQVLIKLRASSLNPADWLIQKYGKAIKDYPTILGLDLAGEVVEVGKGVNSMKRGDRVLTVARFLQNEFMGYQQYALGDAVITCKIPDNISFEQAATLPVVLSTAVTGLFAEFPHGAGLTPPFTPESEGKYRGTPIIILAGASSVGQSVIQIAKISGFSPIITTASLKHTDMLKSLGATNVIDRHLDSSGFTESVKSITKGKMVEIVFAAVTNMETEGHAVAILPKDGMFISTNPDLSDVASNANIKVAMALSAPNVPWNSHLFSTFFGEKLHGWLEKGIIKPNRVEVLDGGLAGVVDGLERLERNAVSGLKLVVRPQDTRSPTPKL